MGGMAVESTDGRYRERIGNGADDGYGLQQMWGSWEGGRRCWDGALAGVGVRCRSWAGEGTMGRGGEGEEEGREGGGEREGREGEGRGKESGKGKGKRRKRTNITASVDARNEDNAGRGGLGRTVIKRKRGGISGRSRGGGDSDELRGGKKYSRTKDHT